MDNELFEIENIEKKDEVEVINLPVLFLALQMEFPFVRLTTFFPPNFYNIKVFNVAKEYLCTPRPIKRRESAISGVLR